MQSLRTRRSQAPGSKPQRAPTKLAKPGAGPTPRSANRTKSRVDDKIKKRMSMRYADISSPTELGNVPEMPRMNLQPDAGAGGYAMGGSMSGGVGLLRPTREQDEMVRNVQVSKEEALVEDRKMLDSEQFDPDAYLKKKLGTSTEAELKTLQSSLRAANDDNTTELQQSVFKNYAEFVTISKEISSLENEMLELKESLSEWKSMPSLLHIDDSASLADRKRAARSSIADLRVLYANQMQTLHSQIEGSAKFAPTVSGRHVVSEVSDISSLNPATFRVDHTVKFVVLDDLVLVARKKRRAGGGDVKWVAERCWPLNEMLVLDTKDSASMTNVFKIRHGKDTYVYRTDVASEKKSLLSLFRQVAEELADKKRKEREGEHERRKSVWTGGGRNSFATNLDKMDWMADLAQQAGINGYESGAKDKAEKDARFVGEWSDELTVAIALKQWDPAVRLVGEGKAKLSTIPSLSTKLTLLSTRLISSLLTALSQPSIRKSSTIALTSYLQRLGAGAAARTTFLDMRTKVLKSHVRKIRFEGHVGAYIGDLTMVCFTCIKHTADWFLASFKENEVASCFIDWAKSQIEAYAEIFRLQVYTTDVDPKVVEDALKITHLQSKRLLQEYGLDFRYLLDELLVPQPKTTSLLLKPSSSSSSIDISRVSTRQIQANVKPNSTSTTTTTTTTISTPSTPSRKRSPAPPPIAPPAAGGGANGIGGYRARTPSTTSSSSKQPPPPPLSGGSFASLIVPPLSSGSGGSATSTSTLVSLSTPSTSSFSTTSTANTPTTTTSILDSASGSGYAHPRPPRTPPPHSSHRSMGTASPGPRSSNANTNTNTVIPPSPSVSSRTMPPSSFGGSGGSGANSAPAGVGVGAGGNVAGPPPPRSLNRPGSQINHRQAAVPVAKREGFF